MSHYPQDWSLSDEAKEAALEQWVEALHPFGRNAIAEAIAGHLRSQPRTKPTPGDIRNRCEALIGEAGRSKGKRESLNFDERQLLDELINGFQDWLKKYPAGSNMHGHAKQFLDHWGAPHQREMEAAE